MLTQDKTQHVPQQEYKGRNVLLFQHWPLSKNSQNSQITTKNILYHYNTTKCVRFSIEPPATAFPKFLFSLK